MNNIASERIDGQNRLWHIRHNKCFHFYQSGVYILPEPTYCLVRLSQYRACAHKSYIILAMVHFSKNSLQQQEAATSWLSDKFTNEYNGMEIHLTRNQMLQQAIPGISSTTR